MPLSNSQFIVESLLNDLLIIQFILLYVLLVTVLTFGNQFQHHIHIRHRKIQMYSLQDRYFVDKN